MLNKQQLEILYVQYPALLEIEPSFLSEAFSSAKWIDIKAGTFIFDELQHCQSFPFILSGDIRVYKQSASGRELSLYNVKAGDACVVTAECLLGNKPYNATGRAQSDSVLVMMPADAFENLLGVRVFREYIFSLFSKRILELMQLVEEVAFHKLDKRLAALLLSRGKQWTPKNSKVLYARIKR